MNDVITLISAIGALGSVVACVKFWMDLGSTRQEAESAHTAVNLVSGKLDVFMTQVARDRVEDAKQYATSSDLVDAEKRTAAGIEGLRTDFRAMSENVGKLVIELIRSRGGGEQGG